MRARKNDLRKLCPRVYSWLYQYDRQFLSENSPDKQRNKGGQFRVNWKNRDQTTLIQVREVVEQMLTTEEKPKRISTKKIEEVSGLRCLMKKHLYKMPLTKEYLQKVVESSEQFGERRIQWAIHQLNAEGEPFLWGWIRRAGIKRKIP